MKEETVIFVLKTYETHFPYFFRDKTKEDKALFTADWMQIFGDIPDETFLKACGQLAKESDYFPSTKEIFDTIKKVKLVEEMEVTQFKYKLVNMILDASMTDEDIERKVWFETEICEWGDPLTKEFYEGERQKAKDYLKNTYGLPDSMIEKFAKKYSELDSIGKQEEFRNKLYDYLKGLQKNLLEA